MFNIGDKVRCVRGAWFDDTKGLVGTIVCSQQYHGFGIDYGYDKEGLTHNYNFHNLDGRLKDNTGYWIEERDLEKVNVKKGNYINYV